MATPDAGHRSRLPESKRADPQPTRTPASIPQADGDARSATGKRGDDLERRSQIERQAYLRYLERGGAPGAELDDWLAAERQVDGRTD